MSEEQKDEVKIVKRTVTPELKLVMNRWISISTDPIDRFTPEDLKVGPKEKWPVVFIRQPGNLEMIAVMEEMSKKTAPAEQSAEQTAIDPGEKSRASMAEAAALGKAALRTWRERVSGMANVTAFDEKEIQFKADEKNVITDECLNRVPWQLLLAVHFRYDDLFNLTDLEREGLDSQPASA